MRNFYNTYRKYILIPLVILVLALFVDTVGVGTLMAKKSLTGIINSSKSNLGQVLSALTNNNSNKDKKKENNNPIQNSNENNQTTPDGSLTCGFDGSAIFNVTNMLPGDSETKNVTVTNNSAVPVMAALKGVRTGPAGETNPLFETILDFTILEGATNVYSNKLVNFFAETDGATLGVVNPSQTRNFDLKVLFPPSAGNEYQNKSVIFDLLCGIRSANHIVINEVFYDVDAAHGIDSWKDRGSPKNDKKKGNDDEWIELYNPTGSDVNVKNWTLEDNASGKNVNVIFHANKTIKAGGFMLISKDASMWKYWNENGEAEKLYSTDFLGDGLGDTGDHLILKDSRGVEVDFVRWESDSVSTGNWTEDVTDPSANVGASIERIVPGFDNDLSSDWLANPSHTPTP